MQIEKTLEERTRVYGSFKDNARVSQQIKQSLSSGKNWDNIPNDRKEALEMIAQKMARIVNGDSSYYDNWHDIIGYAKLVADGIDG